jgi:branched-chain amino acid transport system permease protein
VEYILHLAVMVCIYSILALSLDIVAGHAGLISLAQGAFCGVGAYTSALLALRFGFPFPVSVMASMVLAVAVSLFVSIPSLRLRDDYFVMCSFGFQMILFSLLNNWLSLTGGPLGVNNIPQPQFLGVVIHTKLQFLGLALVFAVTSHVVFSRLVASPYGRVLHSIREDEIFPQSLGKNTNLFKVSAFAVSSSLAALAGSLYAHYVGYIDPTSFTINDSLLVLSMVIIGGAGSIWGPVVGAIALVVLPEALRFLGLPSALSANLRQVVYGSLLVLLMICRPRGLMGDFDFGRK